MTENPTARRVTTDVREGTTFVTVEGGIDYTDGYRVTVGWSDENESWVARLTGCTPEDPVLGMGDTKEAAQLDLACSLASLATCLDDELKEKRAPTPGDGETTP